MRVVKEKVTRRKKSDAGTDMAAEEGAEPSASVAEVEGAPSASAPAPSASALAPALLPSASATSEQAPSVDEVAKAAAVARALQTRA